ncbi:hypothetical protein ACFP1I_11515 [Dyadobacter subterraneus]|uniref:Uncharacterized protein n=1 Tax=Dyadobacter subterraneus TaxID=2773304 RepID=A0ABR9WHA7_9BACT|nr:hypothetical protein [Dyadobacter subterraneus]MBE9463549.1 hypothetical protein [Dyadobacter subterraneus]
MMLQKLKTISTALFFSTLLFFTSCTDHNIESGPLKLTTLKSFGVSGYQIQVDELGDKPVSEYGIVYTSYPRGLGGHNFEPTISDRKIVFTTPIQAGLNTFTGTWRNDGGTFYYYRAYAIVDGNPVYGSHLSYTVEIP